MLFRSPVDLVSFTFVGMADKVVKVQAGKKVVNVKMETNATALADVVVTGYQTLSKERATGSYSVISEKSTKDDWSEKPNCSAISFTVRSVKTSRRLASL